jgi:hypothetical protein
VAQRAYLSRTLKHPLSESLAICSTHLPGASPPEKKSSQPDEKVLVGWGAASSVGAEGKFLLLFEFETAAASKTISLTRETATKEPAHALNRSCNRYFGCCCCSMCAQFPNNVHPTRMKRAASSRKEDFCRAAALIITAQKYYIICAARLKLY